MLPVRFYAGGKSGQISIREPSTRPAASSPDGAFARKSGYAERQHQREKPADELQSPSAAINAPYTVELTAQRVLQMLSVQCGEWWLVDAVDRILNRPCDASASERHAAVRVAADIVRCPADTPI